MNRFSKLIFVIEIISALVFSSSSSAKDTNNRIFKSDLGFEITLPSCLKIEPLYPVHDGESDLKKVDIFIHESSDTKCKFKQKPVLLDVTPRGELENDESVEKWTEKRIKIANQRERMGGSPYLLVKNKIYPSIAYFTVAQESGSILAEAFAVCDKKIFVLRMSDDISKFSDDIVSRIKKGDPSIPEVEEAIIKSFKCLDKP